MPMIEDFSTLTGINRDTLYSWEKGEYRAAAPGAALKHSDLIKNIREASQRMGVKDLHGNAIGQQSLANNWDGMGLNFTQKGIQAQAEAWQSPGISAADIAARHKITVSGKPELPEGL